MRRQSVLLLTMTLLSLFTNVALGGRIVAWGGDLWGRDPWGILDVPDGNDFVAISASSHHVLALRADGTLAIWGDCINMPCSVPEGNDFVAIAAGGLHSLALRSNGKIEAWCEPVNSGNNYGQCDVPDGNYIAIAAGHAHSIGIRDDGTVVDWGWRTDGNFAPPSGNDFVMGAGGLSSRLGFRANGEIVAWTPCDAGACDVPDGNFVDIVARYETNYALRDNGSIVSWGVCEAGWMVDLCNVPSGVGFKDIAPGVAIDSNRALVTWYYCLTKGPGDPCGPYINIVPDGNGFVAVAGGGYFAIALTSSETHTLSVAVEPNFIDTITPTVGEYEHYHGEWVRYDTPRWSNCPNVYKLSGFPISGYRSVSRERL